MISADPPSVWCMAQDCAAPRVIYAGSIHNRQVGSARGKGALAVSEDGGRSWRDISPTGAHDEEVWALATAPDRPGEIFVGTSNARIFHSDDGGRSFSECTTFLKQPGRDRWTFPQPPHIPHVRSLSFDPQDSNTLYVGVEEGGAFRSRDRGETFEPLHSSIYADVHELMRDPHDSRRIYATTGDGLYVSNSGGASWMHVKGMERSYTVPLLASRQRRGLIYTAAAAGPPPTWTMDYFGADALVYRSTDAGESFAPIAQFDGRAHPMRGMVMRLVAHPGDEQIIFGALSDGSVLKIDEREEVISVVAEKLPPIYDLAILP
ncbi:MAG TPA: hypothetical protein VFB15_05945 [Candidatus Binataceae bacterium]|nr:hypothetical protein [Candidatus Binataceae bacterium]